MTNRCMAPEKVFIEVARKLLEFTHFATGGARSAAEGASLGSRGSAPVVVQGTKPPQNF